MTGSSEAHTVREIDTTFDFRTDAGGKDPDSHSPTLRRYHQILWSKPLPKGASFDLDSTTPGEYLHHKSELGEFWLASDSVIPTFEGYLTMVPVLAAFPPSEIEEFQAIGYTIGGMMVFPGNKVDGKQTLNGARGFHPRIRDRMDLTLECIRRHYLGHESPLSDVLARYADFFSLFGSFEGYVRFFLLDDLVDDDYRQVRYFLPFDDFTTSALPERPEAYRAYRVASEAFIEARNGRIDAIA